jgi:hypothetical protein
MSPPTATAVAVTVVDERTTTTISTRSSIDEPVLTPIAPSNSFWFSIDYLFLTMITFLPVSIIRKRDGKRRRIRLRFARVNAVLVDFHKSEGSASSDESAYVSDDGEEQFWAQSASSAVKSPRNSVVDQISTTCLRFLFFVFFVFVFVFFFLFSNYRQYIYIYSFLIVFAVSPDSFLHRSLFAATTLSPLLRRVMHV